MKNYRLVSPAYGTIDIDTLKNDANATSGVQVQPGATGLGLPPLEVQYQAMAGDGAQFRSSRVAQRDIDLTLFVFAPNAPALGALVAQLARVLSGPMRLEAEGTVGLDAYTGKWFLDVRHVGGGDFPTGLDTDHRTEAWLSVTLRAGDPYWQAVTPIEFSKPPTVEIEWGGEFMGLMTAGNDSVGLKVTAHGPLNGFVIQRFNTGDTVGRPALEYGAYVAPGESVVVDFREGTVQSGTGTNLYQHVATGADLSPLSPGGWIQTWANLPTAPQIAAPSAQNHIANPVFAVGPVGGLNPSNGWGGSANAHWAFGGGGLVFDGTERTTSPDYRVTMATGLTVGKLYDLVLRVEGVGKWSNLGIKQAVDGMQVFLDGWGGAPVIGTITPQQGIAELREYRLTFRASRTSMPVSLTPSFISRNDGTAIYHRCLPMTIKGVGIVDSGVPFFSGSSASGGGHSYAWSGTAHASTSTRSTPGTTATSRIAGALYPGAKVLL